MGIVENRRRRIALDASYRAQRLRLFNTVNSAVAAVWAQGFRERDQVITEVLRIVQAGQSTTVGLVDAYMAANTQLVTGTGSVKGLNPKNYTTELLRRKAAEEIYSRPFSALGAFMSKEQDLARSLEAATSSLTRLAQTDLQLAQTHAARDWMDDEKTIVGYSRVLGSGEHCELCKAASTRRYYVSDLAAIHERCGCGVRPEYGDPGELTDLQRMKLETDVYTVVVEPDPELGVRLQADNWSKRPRGQYESDANWNHRFNPETGRTEPGPKRAALNESRRESAAV